MARPGKLWRPSLLTVPPPQQVAFDPEGKPEQHEQPCDYTALPVLCRLCLSPEAIVCFS